MKRIPHSLLYPPHRQIASNQRVAVESALSECKGLFRSPLMEPVTDLGLQLSKHFHEVVDGIDGTHVREGKGACEACKAIYFTAVLAAYMDSKEYAWYQRLKNGESFDLLSLFESIRQNFQDFISTDLRPVTQADVNDMQQGLAFLHWLENKRTDNTSTSNSNPNISAQAAAIVYPDAMKQQLSVNTDAGKAVESAVNGMLKMQENSNALIKELWESNKTPPQTKQSPCTQAQKAQMFDVDVKTIRNWETGKTPAPAGYDADADYATLETMGKLYQGQKSQRSHARVLNRGDYRDFNRQEDAPEFDNVLDEMVWKEEQEERKIGKKPEK